MKIMIEIKNNYGKTTYYPACEKASLLASLAGTKTLTFEAIRTIKELGYAVQIKLPELEI